MHEENKAVSRRILEEVFTEGKMDAIDRWVADDCVFHAPADPDLPAGPAGCRQAVRKYRGAFPDQRMTIEDQIAEGDRVATRWTMHGTHRGPLDGIPPTGKRVEVSGINIDRIVDGKIVEQWSLWDVLGILRQLGRMPPMEEAAD
ncbi:MAG TPA: ester cyclase [Longimicrobiales bacterium]